MAVGKIETAERRVAEAPPGAFTIAVALFLGAVVGIAYWFVRRYRRWRRANHPFAGSFARIARVGTSYRERRATLSELVHVIGEIVQAIEHRSSQ